jgi:hypothetical protein
MYVALSPDVGRTFTGCTSQVFGTYIKEISDVHQRNLGRTSPESMTYAFMLKEHIQTLRSEMNHLKKEMDKEKNHPMW